MTVTETERKPKTQRPSILLGDENKFKDPEPKPKRKSRLEQLGIPKPERRELTEDEQRKTDELAAEFRSCIEPKTSENPWKGFDTGAIFLEKKGEYRVVKVRYPPF